MALAFRSHTRRHGTHADLTTGIFARPSPDQDALALSLQNEQPIIPSPSLFANWNLNPPSPFNGKDDVNTRLPAAAECAAHLELLEAFLALQQKVSTSNALDRALGIQPDRKQQNFQARRALKWPIYTMLAAARFLKWWAKLEPTSLLDRSDGDREVLARQCLITDATLPPLDVLLVWHSLMLNPQNYERFCKKHGRAELYSINLPWQCIPSEQHRAIDHNDRSFTLNPQAAALFKRVIGDVDLFDSLANFESHTPTQLPQGQDSTTLASSLTSTAWLTEKNPPQLNSAPFRNYLSKTFTITLDIGQQSEQATMLRDLSAAVLRQAKFSEKMGSHLWIRSPAVKGTLNRAISRYERFLRLFKEHPGALLVPTLDIDLVWHTHQCSPQAYAACSTTITGRFIKHDNSLEKSILTDGLRETRCLYEDRHKEEYNSCLCWDCEAMKSELERFDSNSEVDFEAIAKKVMLDVTYHKAVETVRRKKNMLRVRDR